MKIGIIGYGVRIDMLMDYFFKYDEDFKIAAITDTNPDRVEVLMNQKDYSEEVIHQMELDKIDAGLRTTPIDASGIRFYDDADKMLDNEELDGVMIGTNCASHVFFAKKVLKRNLPLFMEKPVAITEEDLDDLQKVYYHSKSEVVVSFPLRVGAVVQEVKRIIESGEIGKVDNVQAFNDVPYGYVYFHDWYRDEAKSNGLFLQKATHDLDVINYLVGEMPVEVCAMNSKQIFKGDMPAGLRCRVCEKEKTCTESSYYIKNIRNDIPRSDYCCYAVDTGNEDSGSVIVRYESGMHATYCQNFFARKGAARRGARLYGYKGTIEFAYGGQIKVFDHMSDKIKTIDINTPENGHGGGDDILALNFINVMKGIETSKSPLAAGILSARMCLGAKLSADEKRFVKISKEGEL